MIRFLPTYIRPAFFIIAVCSGCIKSEQCLHSNRTEIACNDYEVLHSYPCAVPEALTLEDIIAIALQRNLPLYVKQLEWAIQKEAATGAKLRMIPELVFNYETNDRNNNPGSSSESLDPGVPPAPPSVSSEKKTDLWDITFTWNLLDFGISYYKARQEANAVLVQQFEYERMKQNIILDITLNYWAAVAAKESLLKTEKYIEKLKQKEVAFVNAANAHFIPRTHVLTVRENILEHEYNINEYKRDYHIALTELKRLMGVPPSTQFRIIYHQSSPCSEESIPDVWTLEGWALTHRPELYAMDREEKISIDEVRVAILEYLPGISLFNAYNYNDNKFLVKNYWNLLGARAVWDLFAIPAGRSRERLAKKNILLVRRDRLALSLAALAQVNLSYLVYLDERERWHATQKIEDIKKQKMIDSEIKGNVGKFDFHDMLEYETEYLEAQVRSLRAYSDMQYSLEQLNNAIGIPHYFRNFEGFLENENGIPKNHEKEATHS